MVCGQPIAMELIHHHRSYHCKYINACRPSPRLYGKGDFVFAKHSVKSNRKRGLIDKVMNSYTGPWETDNKATSSSYELQHRDTGKPSKRHAAHLSHFPREILPFIPVDGADNRYGQLHVPIQSDPYKNAGIKGFKPSQPFIFTYLNTAQSAAPNTIQFLPFLNLTLNYLTGILARRL